VAQPASAQPTAAQPLTAPVVVKDAHYGEVLFYFYQEEYFPAIVRVLAAREQSKIGHHDAEAELLLGGLYLSYGHHLHAAEIFERLLAGNVEPGIRDRIWFFLAKIWHQRGYPEKAQAALHSIEGELPPVLAAERQMLQAQMFIDGGRYDEAIALLAAWKGRNEWASYAQFNLGVAMVRSGRVSEAEQILDDLGRRSSRGEELSALRDKANLALGYAFLQQGRPESAKPPLQRVRLAGPFSNKALLGAGWADAERGDYRAALVPWLELRDRNLLDSAVQESLLAIPYAMARLDSISHAADYYLHAIDAFDAEGRRIDEAIERIEQGVLLDEFLARDPEGATGWYWTLDELPDGTESRYLYHLMATHEFQEGLKNYRDLRYLARNLDRWRENVDVYRDMLETRELAYYERLPRIEESLAQADVEGLVTRKLDFDAHLNNIEQHGDSLALATRTEASLWSEIADLERTPALAADIPEARDAHDKIDLLKGVLQWQLDKAFKERLWNTRHDLRLTGEALVETQRARRSIDQKMHSEPETFAGFNARIAGLEPRIESLLVRVDTSIAQQRAFLQSIAVEELRAQQGRLATYTVQARFALAAIYDLSSTVGEASP
jgi:hypothetical protein